MTDLSKYHLSEDARIVSSRLPGPRSEELIRQQSEIEGSVVSYPKRMPIGIHRAKGAIIEDVDGNYFIDFFGGAGVLNVGHCNSDVLDRVREQQEMLIHALDFPTENKMELINGILSNLPSEIRQEYKVAFGGPTGSDAIEAAIKLAKHKTGRESVIAFQGSYHGMTSGALALTSNIKFRERILSLVPNVHFVPYSYCYRCPFNKHSESCEMECATYLEHILDNPHSGVPKPAAILLEPIQGEGGIIVPKRGFLERVAAIARKHDVILILDEIQSGFFRTGTFTDFLNSSVAPDIFTLSKGLGGIGFPISALVYRKKIESWGTADHIGTFRGNQVSIAAGNAALQFIREHKIDAHTVSIGNYFMEKLKHLQKKNPCIGEVRGRGLFIGVEYVTSAYDKTPNPGIVKLIREICFRKGLLFEVGGHYDNVIRFVPPLIITEKIVDNAMTIFEDANGQALNDSILKLESVAVS